jgi:Fe-S cluster biogenesis protein NfuA
MEKKIVNVYTESNPNPNSLKFCVDFLLVPNGKSFDFAEPKLTDNSPLAKELFKFSGVKRVFITSNFITITKEDNYQWEELIPILKSFIKSYLESGEIIVSDDIMKTESKASENDSDVVLRIKSLLEDYIKPAVEQDGGAITFHSFENGIVKVQLQGSCSGCPSSTMTLKAGIQNLLTRMIPEVKEVIAEGI